MYYNKNYLFTHNIDWYACINGIWIYAASRGGLLPGVVDNESMLPKLMSCFQAWKSAKLGFHWVNV